MAATQAPVQFTGAFLGETADSIQRNFTTLFSGLFQVGNVYYLNPLNGSDSLGDGSSGKPYQTLATAYARTVSGNNDVVVLIGDGGTTATARLSANFDWAKHATHLIGVSSGVNISNRSRIAPTAATTAFANFFTVSGTGCRFQNLQWFQGFDTGTTAQIALTVTGGRNMFVDCHIAGMGDAASAQNASSRNLKISGTGENQFVNCTIGIDTVTRTVANASVEFAGGAPRNEFKGCVFPIMTSSATVLGVIVSAAAGSDRFQLFKDCLFINAVNSSSTVMSGLATLAASMGGMLMFKDSTLVGITEFGTDATSRGQIVIDGGTVTAATSGIAVNPT